MSKRTTIPDSIAAPRRTYRAPALVRVRIETARAHLQFTYGDPASGDDICSTHTHSSTLPAACSAP